jgi:predicted AlkP superfamily phosphohydrolase/phosphomutase
MIRKALLLVAALATACAFAQERPERLVVVSWDGAPDWVIERMLREDKLPHTARLAERGARATMIQAFPSVTATGHVTLFTGAWPSTHGVVGNAVPLLPRAAHTVRETRSGFDARSMLVEPLWVTAAKSGRRVVALSAAGSFPPAPHVRMLQEAGVAADRFVQFSGFEAGIVGSEMIRGEGAQPVERAGLPSSRRPVRREEVEVAGVRVEILALDDPADPVDGYDTVEIRWPAPGVRPVTLKPQPAGDGLGEWAGPFQISRGELTGLTYFRLFSLDPATGRMELYRRRAAGLQGTEGPDETLRYLRAYGGFHDDAFFDTYGRGGLGPPIYRGGDGTAERRMLEIVRLDMEFVKRGFRYALERWNPDLLFHYTPMSDSAGHTWMGILDPDLPGHDPALAAKIWPFYEEVFRLQDAWLGDMIEAAGPQTAFALISDHGMAGAHTYFNGNYVLQQAGLLTLDGRGQIDFAKTRALVPPWGHHLVAVNSTEWKGGIVPAEEVEAVVRQVEAAFLAARDPESGRPMVLRTFRPAEFKALGIGGPAGGDLYFDLADGYYPSNRTAAEIVSRYDPVQRGGVHGMFPYRQKMHTIFIVGGPGVTPGTRLPTVRAVDVAPTLSRLLGIPAPAQSEGVAVPLGG